jgi:hypothetical protein
LKLGEEYRLRVSENRVLKKIVFGPKRDEIVGGWRKLHEGLYNIYTLPNVINLAQGRDPWLALVNTVMNLRVPEMLGNS